MRYGERIDVEGARVTELLRLLRQRVDEIIRPHQELYGPDCVAAKMALLVLAEAELLAHEIDRERVTTERAAELTGWHPETLQSAARAKLAGLLRPRWAGLEVEVAGNGYLFVLSSIPPKPGRRVA